jgi:hypothetical protein
MRILLRLLASAVILAAAGYAVMELVVPPYRCNRIRQRVAVRTELLPSLSRFHMLDVTRENLNELRPCAESTGRRIDDYVLLAVNENARGQNARVLALYEQAIRFEPRPEIYAGLAEAQINAFQREAARHSLLMAGYSAHYVNAFPDPELREEVQTQLLAREQRLRASVRPLQ